ncbi:MAG: hypothetical protein ABIR96_00045 [Bdellovibrionota bacterium]
MSRHLFRAIFGTTLLLISLNTVQARTLVVPYPGLLEQEGLLQPSVLLGKPGFSMEGLASNGVLPSRFSVAGAFPLFSQTTLRGSGWMWAVRTGITDYTYDPGTLFAAGHYSLEVGLGRGTAAPLFEDRSGLRGYMELSLRTERARYDRRVTEISQTLGNEVRDKKTFVSLKIGAGSSLDSEGLVNQKPGTWGNRVQMQVYLPMLPTSDHAGKLANLMVQGYRLCPTQVWLCGWQLSYHHNFKTVRGANFEELSDLAGFGIFVNYYRREDYNISTRLTWPWVGNAIRKGFESLPVMQLLLTKSY